MTATRVSEKETCALLREAHGRTLVLDFGPGWSALRDTKENDWALRLLLDMRGAGIEREPNEMLAPEARKEDQ